MAGGVDDEALGVGVHFIQSEGEKRAARLGRNKAQVARTKHCTVPADTARGIVECTAFPDGVRQRPAKTRRRLDRASELVAPAEDIAGQGAIGPVTD